MNLSPHFTLAEMTRTGTGLSNSPDAKQIAYMRCLCLHTLEPLRSLVGPLRVNSGYRSTGVNDAVKGSLRSQHLKGQAADVVPVKASAQKCWDALLRLMANGLPVDQAILYEARNPWIHISYTPDRNPRKAILVRVADGSYVSWDEYLKLPDEQRMFT